MTHALYTHKACGTRTAGLAELEAHIRVCPADRPQPEYLSAAETAKYVRAALKREFPGVKFSVTSKTFSGGASIDVRWVDGPTAKTVDDVINRYAGASFDGSIDMETCHDHWLLPDGTTKPASSPGTERSKGYLPAYKTGKPHPEARLVSFGAKYISSDRKFSPDFLRSVAEVVSKRYRQDPPEVGVSDYDGRGYFKEEGPAVTDFYPRFLSQRIYHVACGTPEGGEVADERW